MEALNVLFLFLEVLLSVKKPPLILQTFVIFGRNEPQQMFRTGSRGLFVVT